MNWEQADWEADQHLLAQIDRHTTPCAYCGPRTGAPAKHWDHLVSKADRRRTRPDGSFVYPGDWENETVPACYACNIFKSTRHLTPPSDPRLAELQAIDSTWREWSGDPSEDAFRKVHTA